MGNNLKSKEENRRWGSVLKILIPIIMVLGMIIFSAGFMWYQGGQRVKQDLQMEIDKLRSEIVEKDNRIKELEEEAIVVNPVAPEIVLQIINSEIREIGELATVEYMYTDAGRYSHSHTFFEIFDLPFTEKYFTMKWDGIIKAGIDVTKITTEIIQTDQETQVLRVYIPKAKILSHDPDKESIEIFDEHDGLFNPVSASDQVEFDVKNEKAMEERAIENGLLEKAEKNAKEIILRLLNANPDIKEYYRVEFKELQE